MVWMESLRQAKGMLRSWSNAGEAGTTETSQDTTNLALHVLTGNHITAIALRRGA